MRIGEADVGAAGAGELGIQLEAVADIADDNEGRATLAGGEVLHIAAGLVIGALQREVPCGGAAFAVTEFGRIGGFHALLGFEDEGAAAVEVYAPGGDGAVGPGTVDAALEDVGILGVVRLGGIGPREVEEVAEFEEEELGIGALGSAGVFPAGDEGLDGGGGWLGEVGHGRREVARPCPGLAVFWGVSYARLGQ